MYIYLCVRVSEHMCTNSRAIDQYSSVSGSFLSIFICHLLHPQHFTYQTTKHDKNNKNNKNKRNEGKRRMKIEEWRISIFNAFTRMMDRLYKPIQYSQLTIWDTLRSSVV